MKTCSLLLLLVTFSGCLSMAARAEAEQEVRRYSLKYVAADAALRAAFESLSTLDNSKPPGLEDGRPALLKMAVGATKLTSDPRTNALTVVSANTAHLELLEKLLKEIDAKPTVILASAILLEVRLGPDTKHAIDVLDLVDSVTIDGIKVDPKKIADAPALNHEQRKQAFAAYAKALGDLEECEVLARPSIYLQDGEQGTLSAGSDGDETQMSITPAVQDDQTIKLKIQWKRLSNRQALETSLHVPNFAITTVGGVIREDGGAKKERLMLLQPTIK